MYLLIDFDIIGLLPSHRRHATWLWRTAPVIGTLVLSVRVVSCHVASTTCRHLKVSASISNWWWSIVLQGQSWDKKTSIKSICASPIDPVVGLNYHNKLGSMIRRVPHPVFCGGYGLTMAVSFMVILLLLFLGQSIASSKNKVGKWELTVALLPMTH